jgi:hypothetical protein
MVDYWTRLKPEMDAKGVTKAALSRKLGISYQAIKKIVDGGAFGVENNFKAARLLGLSPEWLSSGKGAKYASQAGTGTPDGSNEDVSAQNSLAGHLVALEIAVDQLAPELRTAGRDALCKWANKDASASESAGTLDALAKASRAMAAQKKSNGASGPLGKAA